MQLDYDFSLLGIKGFVKVRGATIDGPFHTSAILIYFISEKSLFFRNKLQYFY